MILYSLLKMSGSSIQGFDCNHIESVIPYIDNKGYQRSRLAVTPNISNIRLLTNTVDLPNTVATRYWEWQKNGGIGKLWYIKGVIYN